MLIGRWSNDSFPRPALVGWEAKMCPVFFRQPQILPRNFAKLKESAASAQEKGRNSVFFLVMVLSHMRNS